jgi:hypothetical protein
VALTLRLDFFGALSDHPFFGDALSHHHVLVGPMLDEELRNAIAKPAEHSGFTLPQPVIDRLVDQARHNASALPLVQHALYRFWSRLEAAQDDESREAALNSLTDIGPSMAQTADQLMGTLDGGSQGLAWPAFLAGVQLGEGVTDTRRRVSMREILPSEADEAALRSAIEPFVEERLLSVGGDPDSPYTTWVEITHEALIEHWGNLRSRLTPEAREKLRLERQAQEAAELWRAGKGGVWQGPSFVLLRQLGRDRRLTKPVKAFLAASERIRLVQLVSAFAAVMLLVFAAGGASYFLSLF